MDKACRHFPFARAYTHAFLYLQRRVWEIPRFCEHFNLFPFRFGRLLFGMETFYEKYEKTLLCPCLLGSFHSCHNSAFLRRVHFFAPCFAYLPRSQRLILSFYNKQPPTAFLRLGVFFFIKFSINLVKWKFDNRV